MERYELEGLAGEINKGSSMVLKTITDYMQHGDFLKYVVVDTVTEKKDGRTVCTKEPKVVTLPCINMKELERASNIIKKLSKVVESSLNEINPEKQEWQRKSPWQQWRDSHCAEDYSYPREYTTDDRGCINHIENDYPQEILEKLNLNPREIGSEEDQEMFEQMLIKAVPETSSGENAEYETDTEVSWAAGPTLELPEANEGGDSAEAA
jgi:hypothetical protein